MECEVPNAIPYIYIYIYNSYTKHVTVCNILQHVANKPTNVIFPRTLQYRKGVNLKLTCLQAQQSFSFIARIICSLQESQQGH